ncbi:YoaK family protein [Enterococcus sp. AZ072]|uniref:YoaK family protein n=1 Tax=unclassified Enterococcus TaxID=2608891 RepID=UPI003D2A7DDB
MLQTKQKINSLTVLTLFATFLMGFIDAYTFIEKDGVFVSAQTGNMVAFSSKLFTGHFAQAAGHIAVFVGFAIGAFCGEWLVEKVSGAVRRKYQMKLLLQSAVLLVFAIFQQQLNDSFMVFLLGGLAGFELTLFRKVGVATFNDGIMTGNTKNLMSNLYRWLFEKDKAARKEFSDIGFAILVFILGVGFGSLIVLLNASFALWCAFILTLLFFGWVTVTNVEMD